MARCTVEGNAQRSQKIEACGDKIVIATGDLYYRNIFLLGCFYCHYANFITY